MPARYIALEGVDGCGKSTQARTLAEKTGMYLTREPGGTDFGSRVRSIMLDPASQAVPNAELLLVNASRIQLLEELVVPTLAQKKSVISDRCYLSSLAYQGYGSGVSLDYVRAACELGVNGHYPDRIVLIDLDSAEAERRRSADASARDDRFEQEENSFRKRVIAGYRAEARRDPARIVVVDGVGSYEEVYDRIWAQIEPLLN